MCTQEEVLELQYIFKFGEFVFFHAHKQVWNKMNQMHKPASQS